MHGRLPLVDAIVSRRRNTRRIDIWDDINYIDFTIGSSHPYEITPPQTTRTMLPSRELQLARQKYLHRCAPLVHVAISIYLVFDIFNAALRLLCLLARFQLQDIFCYIYITVVHQTNHYSSADHSKTFELYIFQIQ